MRIIHLVSQRRRINAVYTHQITIANPCFVSKPLFQTSPCITLGQADRKKKEKRSTVLIIDYYLMFQDLLSANRCVACFAETRDNGSFIPQRQAQVTDSIRCTADHVRSHFQLLENTLITKSPPVLRVWDKYKNAWKQIPSAVQWSTSSFWRLSVSNL